MWPVWCVRVRVRVTARARVRVLMDLAAATAFCNVKNGCAELPSPGGRVRVRVRVS